MWRAGSKPLIFACSRSTEESTKRTVPPIAPDRPTYPRSFENTVLAFLVFAGIYLMVSLTAAILREQVSG